MSTPERKVLTDWRQVADGMYAAAEGIRELPIVGAAHLADLLVHLADEMSDENAVEVEWPGRTASLKRTVVTDHGMGEERDSWTAAWAYARTALQIPATHPPAAPPTLGWLLAELRHAWWRTTRTGGFCVHCDVQPLRLLRRHRRCCAKNRAAGYGLQDWPT